MDFLQQHLLSILIFWPLLAALLIALLPREQSFLLKSTALAAFVVEFIFALILWRGFVDVGPEYQFIEELPWIGAWNVWYRVGVDGVSVSLIMLTAFLTPLALLGTWNSVTKDLKLYLICLLALTTGMLGAFCAFDLFLFYVFWEVMLVPMYLLIGIWGGENRNYAAVKFFLYTLAGSVLMLVAFVYLHQALIKQDGTATFNLMELANYRLLPFRTQLLVFGAFALAFAIKVPLFPLHTWLPDAHVQAPTIGSVVLAGVLLKMGVYGFFRIAIPLFPDAVVYLKPWLMGVAAVGVVYGALVAMVQPDMKKLVAYSSVSHMGVVMLGLFSLNPTGITGGLYQMLNHGISTGMLFLLIGMVYDRTHTRQIADYSGLAKRMPVFTVFFLIATFSSIAVPLTNGFVGEFLSLLGAFQENRTWAIVGATGVVFGAVYMLWLVQRVFFGPVKDTHGTERDLVSREVAVLAVLALTAVIMGVRPQMFLEKLSRPGSLIPLKISDERPVLKGP